MINETLFNQIVTDAKAKTTDKKWLAAIARAAAGILSGEFIVTTLAHGALVTTASGTYAANGHCSCEAARHGHKECKHRAAARLMDRYETEVAAQATFTADVETTPRKTLIVEIKACWPATWPPLAVELMARFRCNDLNFLDDDQLRRVRMAIAL